jgi:hypothetical protein
VGSAGPSVSAIENISAFSRSRLPPDFKPWAKTAEATANARGRGARGASACLCEHFLQHLLIERQIQDQVFQRTAFVFHLTHSPRLHGPHAAVLLLPDAERRLADAVLTQQLVDRDARLGLPEHVDDLGLRVNETFSWADPSSRLRENSSVAWLGKPLAGHDLMRLQGREVPA